MLVGGSALYTRAILDRFEFPGTDEAVRAAAGGRARARSGPPALHAGCARVDPEAAAGSCPTTAAASCAPSRSSRSPAGPTPPACPTLEYADPRDRPVGVDIDRPTLDERIAQRVAQMFDGGLRRRGRAAARPRGSTGAARPGRAIGYREVAAYLARRAQPRRGHREQTAAATRRFARRQDAWFRKDPRIVWVRWDDPDRPSARRARGARASATLEP